MARLAVLAAALLLNVALFAARPAPARAWLHPVAPPLTHIAEMGESVLGGAAPGPSVGAAPGPSVGAAPGAAGRPHAAAPPPGAAPGPHAPGPHAPTPHAGAAPEARTGTGAADAPPGAPGRRTAERVPPGPPGSPHPGGPPRGNPPLRGLAGALERVVRANGTPDQRAALAALQATDVLSPARRAMDLRIAVQADAVALAEALGPDRVGAILARKDDLSTRIGEGRAWATAIERLR